MSSRIALGMAIILIALLSFMSVLFSSTPNDIYFPGTHSSAHTVSLSFNLVQVLIVSLPEIVCMETEGEDLFLLLSRTLY